MATLTILAKGLSSATVNLSSINSEVEVDPLELDSVSTWETFKDASLSISDDGNELICELANDNGMFSDGEAFAKLLRDNISGGSASISIIFKGDDPVNDKTWGYLISENAGSYQANRLDLKFFKNSTPLA